jgi:hypothetical protein
MVKSDGRRKDAVATDHARILPGPTVNVADEGQPPVLMSANRKARRAAMADERRRGRKGLNAEERAALEPLKPFYSDNSPGLPR